MRKLISILGIAAMFFSTQLMAQEGSETKSKEQNKDGYTVQNQHRVQTQQSQQNANFVDEDGDGFNDLAQEAAQNQKRNGKRNAFKKMEKSQKKQANTGFIDENGDGFNDNAQDSDGDGIPNGQDPDYEGVKARKGLNAKGFIDEDGDGINDNAMDADGDGIPNGQDEDFVRPANGSGAQQGQRLGGGEQGSAGADCDGTATKARKGRN